ncbi:hypothetical protein [Mesorhizobium sp. f-mel]
MKSEIAGILPEDGRVAANDNRNLNPGTSQGRKQILYATDAFLKANPQPPQPTARIRYRGGRPAMNWLAKHDARGAASLWLIARQRQPEGANDNQADAEGMGIDRRKDDKPRGKNPDPRSLDAYIALPAERPRLGDAEPQAVRLRGWFKWFDLKPQREAFDFHPDCRFGFCAPAIAEGAIFLGSIGGLGQPKMGKCRGDIRRQDKPETPTPSEEIDTVIEVILARGNVADVGRALGAKGGGADRRGGRALRDAGRWAAAAIADSESRHVWRAKAA